MYLIGYDITNDKIRTKVAQKLSQHGYERIQYSVFAGHFHPEELKLWASLENLLQDYPNESIFCVKISTESFENMRIIGNFGFDIRYLCGKKSSLII